VWIAALPLFHTHLPGDLDQAVGVPHTVFSRDLPGEYRAFHHKTTPNESDLSGLAPNSPELGFVASLGEDGKRKPWEAGASLLAISIASPAYPGSQWIHQTAIIDLNSRWLPYSHGFRGPPAPVSL
jgi:hypothetical protein